RDIKPANIIRREIDNKLVLIDFGVVKNQVNSVGAASNQTALTAFAVGTPGFAPPEQLAMRPVYASDVYALGVTCMYLMSGKAPKNMECDPITGDINWFKYVDVSDSFAEILSKMLEVAVKSRYKTAEEVLQALDLENHVDSLAESMLGYSGVADTNISNTKIGSGDSRRNRNPATRTSRRTSTSSRSASSSRYSRSSRSKTSAENSLTSANKTAKTPTKPLKISATELLAAYSSGRKDFSFKDLSMQDLQKADLSESRFSNAKLVRTNFQGADLSRSNFANSDVRQAMFRNADLSNSFFRSSNLEGVDLRGANLSHTNFKSTKLKGANLCGANLSHTNLTQEQLESAKTNWMTIMPSGKRGFW
ncbi:MAG: pentapeptide repeat-containing protein, partial [Cyanobacteria bacterium P01_A01_bin.83]